MRSSGRTTVSRTRERMPSVRRRRRGRCVRPARVRVSVSGEVIVFVVIHLSVVKLDRTGLRAEAAAHSLVRAVGAIPLAADDATIEAGRLFGLAACGASSWIHHGHAKFFPLRGVEYYPPVALVWRCSSDG